MSNSRPDTALNVLFFSKICFMDIKNLLGYKKVTWIYLHVLWQFDKQFLFALQIISNQTAQVIQIRKEGIL